MALLLNQKALSQLPTLVSVPRYDRSHLSPGIVHIGVGNFHRAHQAVYMDQLFNKGIDHDWAIIGAGIKPYDFAMREKLQSQDWLSTVIELDPEEYTARITGAMIDIAEISSNSLIQTLLNPAIRIVSMTITEGGYFIDPQSGGFDPSYADVVHDIANPNAPRTVFGALVVALKQRKAAGIAPFTVMSCDNVPGNGDVTKQAVVGIAHLMAPDLVNWIEGTVAFPNSMVDCITPATGDREREMVIERFGITDPGVVVCEPFRQWVIEDHFPGGRPALEEVGVEFVKDVASHELMKLRILNGGHAAIAYAAALFGLKYAHDAMNSSLIRGFLDRLEIDEIIPTVPPVPGVEFGSYFEITKSRFANPEIGDTIVRLCFDGSNRQPKFVFPVLLERIKDGLPITGLALEVALWCRYCAGVDEAGNPIDINDDNAERLQQHALQAKSDPSAFLAMSDIFGSLSDNTVFKAAFASALNALWQKGVKSTLDAYIKAGSYE